MISVRRSFILSVVFTAIVLIFLAACNLQSSSKPAATVTVGAGGAPAATASGAAPTGPTATGGNAGASAAPPANAAATPQPTLARGGTLTVRDTGAITDFKPWDLRNRDDEYIANLLYNGLVRLDESLKPQPDLADHWDVSPNGGIITFTLRSGLTWHDGKALTGDDVVWTLNSLRALTVTNALLSDFQSTIAQVRSPITGTVVLSLTHAYAPLLADLVVPILPRHQLQARTIQQLAALNFLDEPLGSGPFKLGDRNEKSIDFVRNAQYFRGPPNLDRVTLVITPDPARAAGALNDGTLLLSEFASTGEMTATQGLAGSLKRGGYPENGSYFLAFNVRSGRLFSDVRLRQALSLAVDVPKLVAEVTGGRGQPLATSLSPAAWAFTQSLTPTPPDLDRARQLLDAAGWTQPAGQTVRTHDGVTLTAQIFVRGDDPRRVLAAQKIASAAEQIGMKLTVVPADFRTVILSKLAPPYDFDLLLSSWVNAPNSAGFPTNRFYDPDDYAIFGADRIWKGPGDTRSGLRNIGGFANPDYESAAKRARTTYDPKARAEAIVAAQTVILRERPYLFLWTDRIPVAFNQKVQAEGAGINLASPRYPWDLERYYLK
jgi:peptide/nickel transport system substrate-binding protein